MTPFRRWTVALTVVLAIGAAACDRVATGALKQEPLPSTSSSAQAPAVKAAAGAASAKNSVRSGEGFPSFGRDIEPVLEKTCTQADNCHGNVPAEAIDMDLRPPAAYEALVGRPAQARHGALRVAPGNVPASFLVSKLVGPLKHGEGKLMPLDPDTGAPAKPSPLPPDFVERVLKPWIAAGAQNN
jgi:hypothetical protein